MPDRDDPIQSTIDQIRLSREGLDVPEGLSAGLKADKHDQAGVVTFGRQLNGGEVDAGGGYSTTRGWFVETWIRWWGKK